MSPLTPLVRPDRFFAEEEFHALRLLLVVVVLTLSLPVTVYGLGWGMTERIDGTVMVDNPDRPSEAYCEGAPEGFDQGCDQPAKVERDVDSVLWEAVGEVARTALLGFPLVLALFGGALHVTSWLFDAENGLLESFAVTAWGLVPSLFAVGASLVVFWATFDPITVTTATEPATLLERATAELQPVARLGPVISGVTALWSGVVWRFGLQHARGLSGSEATLAAAVVTVLYLLGALL